jgi:hypothetical protein
MQRSFRLNVLDYRKECVEKTGEFNLKNVELADRLKCEHACLSSWFVVVGLQELLQCQVTTKLVNLVGNEWNQVRQNV